MVSERRGDDRHIVCTCGEVDALRAQVQAVREERDKQIDRVSSQEAKTRHLEKRLDSLTVRVRRLGNGRCPTPVEEALDLMYDVANRAIAAEAKVKELLDLIEKQDEVERHLRGAGSGGAGRDE